MTQPTNMLVNGDDPGAVYTVALNEILSAHTTIFAGTTAPASPVANMVWQDTSEDPPRFYRRNATNSAWDNMGRFSNGAYDGDIPGHAATCDTLTSPRAIAVSNDATGSASFNGSADANIALTLKTVNSTVGTFGTTTKVPGVTYNAKGLATNIIEQNIAFPVTSFNGRPGAIVLTTADVAAVSPAPWASEEWSLVYSVNNTAALQTVNLGHGQYVARVSAGVDGQNVFTYVAFIVMAGPFAGFPTYAEVTMDSSSGNRAITNFIPQATVITGFKSILVGSSIIHHLVDIWQLV